MNNLLAAGTPYRYQSFRHWPDRVVVLTRRCRARKAGWGDNAVVVLPAGTELVAHGMGHDGVNCTIDGGAYDLLGDARLATPNHCRCGRCSPGSAQADCGACSPGYRRDGDSIISPEGTVIQ